MLVDDPKLTVKLVRGRNPRRIIVDSRARTPLDARVVKTARETPTIIAVTGRAPKDKVRALREAGASILVCGSGQRVSLPVLMRKLRAMGIRRFLLEGGGTLNWNMLTNGLVDEISVAISPRIVGGANAITLVEGEGAARISEAVKLRLIHAKKYGSDLVLRYVVSG